MDELLRGARQGLRAWAPLLLLLVLAWSLAGLGLALRRRAAAWRLARRMGRARRAEGDAVGLLAARGYRVLASQVLRELVLEVDGQPRGYVVRADHLVAGPGGARFVAEVKSGDLAPDPLHVPTRRQLLEYALAFAELDGVLLVDVERGTVRAVRFLGPS